MTETRLISGADVQVAASTNRQNVPVAVATIRGTDENGRNFEAEHRFPTTSRISKSLDLMTPVQLSERLSGGHYFFVGGCLFDFRDGNYNGFIHTRDNIEHLKRVIGIEVVNANRNSDRSQSRNYRLAKHWSTNDIVVPQFGEGGKFDSRLTYTWSPFSSTIRSAFDIVRLICENGMTGLTALFGAKIPLENRWEEHLDIASAQIQNKLNSMVGARFQGMAGERATIADCQLLETHARNRLDSILNSGDVKRREQLRNIINAVSPELQLTNFYKESVFNDRRLGAQLPAHLTAFDAYNIATELSSHTAEGNGSSDFALDRFANQLVFDRADRRQHAARFGAGPSQAAFSDPDAAFFGEIN